MRNKAFLYFDEEKSNNKYDYYLFVFDIRINPETTLNGQKNNTFKKKILKFKTNNQVNDFTCFNSEFSIIKTKYFVDEFGTPFIPNFQIETNSPTLYNSWKLSENVIENKEGMFSNYLSSYIFSLIDKKFISVDEIITHLNK